jgi:hypothetical protein
MLIDYVTIKKFSELTGYSENAIRANIKLKKWHNGEIWVKREGRILLSLSGFNAWVEMEVASKQRPKRVLKSHSSTRGGNAEKELSLSPPPLI